MRKAANDSCSGDKLKHILPTCLLPPLRVCLPHGKIMKCQPAPFSMTGSACPDQGVNRVSEQSEPGTGTRMLSLKTFTRSLGVKTSGAALCGLNNLWESSQRII